MATRKFKITQKKAVFDEYFASVSLATWLGTETISNVTFTGWDITDGASSATRATDVLDQNKCTYTTTKVKPWIQKGAQDHKYRIKMQVKTNADAQFEIYLDFSVQNLVVTSS